MNGHVSNYYVDIVWPLVQRSGPMSRSNRIYERKAQEAYCKVSANYFMSTTHKSKAITIQLEEMVSSDHLLFDWGACIYIRNIIVSVKPVQVRHRPSFPSERPVASYV